MYHFNDRAGEDLVIYNALQGNVRLQRDGEKPFGERFIKLSHSMNNEIIVDEDYGAWGGCGNGAKFQGIDSSSGQVHLPNKKVPEDDQDCTEVYEGHHHWCIGKWMNENTECLAGNVSNQVVYELQRGNFGDDDDFHGDMDRASREETPPHNATLQHPGSPTFSSTPHGQQASGTGRPLTDRQERLSKRLKITQVDVSLVLLIVFYDGR